MTDRITGAFDVKLTPQSSDPLEGAATLARLSLDKQFHGELEATSKGEMISAMTSVKGSAVYSAIERVDGALKGKRGTFVLQHTGIMNRGVPSLIVAVAPDSGTGELAGLTGTMNIRIEGGRHFYDFEYELNG